MGSFLGNARIWLQDPTIAKLVYAAIALLIVFVATKLAQRTASRYVEEKTSRYRVRKSLGFVGYAAAAIALMTVFSDRLGELSVVFGVAGAGIAFALQEVIASVAGWAALSFGGFYGVGDRVQLGGIKGDVVDIGVLRTTIAEVGQWVNGDLYNGRMVRVANSFVFKEPVVNYSGDFPFLWDEITVPIRFESDLQKAGDIMQAAADQVCEDYQREAAEIWQEMAKKYPLEPATTKPMVTFTFDENWVTYIVRYPVRFDKRRTAKHLLSASVLRGIGQTDGSVSVAATAMELFPMKPFTVHTPKSQ